MAGDYTITTLLVAAAVVGTGGAALAAVPAVAAGTGAFATGLVAASGTLATVGTVATLGLTAQAALTGREAAQQRKVDIEEQANQERTSLAKQRRSREESITSILSSQQAIFGARGIALGSGVSQTAAQQSTGQFTRESATASLGGQFRQTGFRNAAAGESLKARSAITGGAVSLLKAGTA